MVPPIRCKVQKPKPKPKPYLAPIRMPPNGYNTNSGQAAGAVAAGGGVGVQGQGPTNGYGVMKKKSSGVKRLPNMFILYYMEMYKRYGGSMYFTARECGRRWRMMSFQEKQKYRLQYLTNRRDHLLEIQAQKIQAAQAKASAAAKKSDVVIPSQQNPAADAEE